MKNFVACTILSLVMHNVLAQPLKVGDKMPLMQLQNVMNYSSSVLDLMDFKDKLIILQFWSHSCTACIGGFSRFDSLQRKFDKKIQVIYISRHTMDSTKKFLSKHKKIKLPAVPFVTGDTLLAAMFPHYLFPHDVWIAPGGEVSFITSSHNATEQNIEKFLAGEKLQLAGKIDLTDFDYDVPVTTEGNGRWLDKVEYYSTIMHRIPANIGSKKTKNYFRRNSASAKSLLTIAFTEGKYLHPSMTDWQLEDSFKFTYPDDKNVMDEWLQNYSYFYEIKVPDRLSSSLYKFMQQDLVRFFDLDVKFEKRKLECFVLSRINKKDKMATDGRRQKSNYWLTGQDTVYWNNFPFAAIVSKFRNIIEAGGYDIPVIDETNYAGNVDMALRSQGLYDLNWTILNEDLKKYGLKLQQKRTWVEVLVIREKNLE